MEHVFHYYINIILNEKKYKNLIFNSHWVRIVLFKLYIIGTAKTVFSVTVVIVFNELIPL